MIIGYARCSNDDQNLDLQLDALRAAGCEFVFEEYASGARQDRPQLAEMLKYIRKGDQVVVWKLDRLGRTMRQLVTLVADFRERGIDFRSLTDGIDTSTPVGRFTFHILGALAEMERDLIRERTLAGLKSARARGRNGGRKPKLTPKQIEQAKRWLADPAASVEEVARRYGVNRATIYRAIGLGANRRPMSSANPAG
jgi:DNA invertase Pin-like site-specific DNA recombinase